MDTYQPIFDAVRSRLGNCDFGNAVADAMRNENIGYFFSQAVTQAMSQFERPSTIYRPVVTKDGDMWIALYGANIQEGVAGCGKTPAEAMAEFDNVWYKN